MSPYFIIIGFFIIIIIRMKVALVQGSLVITIIIIMIIMIIARMEVALVQGGLVITIMMDRRETLVRAGAGLDDNG